MANKREYKKETLDKLRRVDLRFIGELEKIKKERVENGMDKFKISDRTITSLIPRHKHWDKIKKDIIQYKLTKKHSNGN